MSPLWILLAVLTGLALVALGFCAGVWANMRLARAWERDAPLDEHQAAVFAPARARLWQRASGVLTETYWQGLAFAGQVRHGVRRYRFPAPRPDGGLPVVLVGGYLENAGVMQRVGRRLQAAGFQPVLLDLPSTLSSLEENAAWVRARLAELRAQSGYERLGFVGHSMGGVIGRICALSAEDPGLALVISVASPHRGTRLARLGAGQSARDMEEGSPLWERYPPHAVGHAPLKALIAREDNIVSPAWSAVLPAGETVLLAAPLGHAGVLYHREAEERILAWLAEVRPEPSARPAPAQAPALA